MMQKKYTRYRVREPHPGTDGEPLTVSEGERLAYERKKCEWAGWIWCTSQSGRSGWVPEAWVFFDGKTCVMRRDYESQELSVCVGDILSVAFLESGWAWGVKETGSEGWVPMRCLTKVADHSGIGLTGAVAQLGER